MGCRGGLCSLGCRWPEAFLLFFSGNSSHRLYWECGLSHLFTTLCNSVHVTLNHTIGASTVLGRPRPELRADWAELSWLELLLAISAMLSIIVAQLSGHCRREPPFSLSSHIYFFLKAVTAALQTHLTGLERITLSPAQFSLDACFSVSLAKQKNSNTCTN